MEPLIFVAAYTDVKYNSRSCYLRPVLLDFHASQWGKFIPNPNKFPAIKWHLFCALYYTLIYHLL